MKQWRDQRPACNFMKSVQFPLFQENPRPGLKGTLLKHKSTTHGLRPKTGFLMVDPRNHADSAKPFPVQRSQVILVTTSPKVSCLPTRLPSFKEIKLNRQDKSRRFLRSFKFPVADRRVQEKKQPPSTKRLKRAVLPKFKEILPVSKESEAYLKYIEWKYSTSK